MHIFLTPEDKQKHITTFAHLSSFSAEKYLDDPVSIAFPKVNYQYIKKIDSGDYSLHFWRSQNIIIVLEEAHKYNLSGQVNHVQILAYFDPSSDNAQRQFDFNNLANKFCLGGGFTTPWEDGHYKIGMHPMRRINNLISAIACLQDLNPQKGIAKYFDSGINETVDYVIR